MQNEVSADNIQNVVDGFKEFFRQVAETNSFSAVELKNFMEPIFEQAGYRTPVTDETTDNKILILHEDRAGELVSMSPAVREIRRIRPTAHITLVAGKRAKNLARCCPHVDEVIIGNFFMNNGQSFTNFLNNSPNIVRKSSVLLDFAAKHLLTHRCDIAFAGLYGNSSMPLLAYMSGAKRRISHKSPPWVPLLTDVVSQEGRGFHAADKALSYVEHLIGTRITDRRMEAWFNQDDLAVVKNLIPASEKRIAICVGAQILKNHYPPASYGKLISLIAKEYDRANFIVLGGSAEVKEAAALIANVDDPSRVINLTGKISYRQTAAAISLCDIYIGNDTGATHLAAATGTPVLSPHPFPLDLGRTNFNLKRWYPYGVPSVVICPAHALPECVGSKDLRGCRARGPHCITPQNLFDAYKVLLEQIDKGIDHYVLFNPEKGVV